MCDCRHLLVSALTTSNKYLLFLAKKIKTTEPHAALFEKQSVFQIVYRRKNNYTMWIYRLVHKTSLITSQVTVRNLKRLTGALAN